MSDTFGRFMQQLRVRRRLTVNALSRQSGVSRDTIYRYETDPRFNGNTAKIRAILESLNSVAPLSRENVQSLADFGVPIDLALPLAEPDDLAQLLTTLSVLVGEPATRRVLETAIDTARAACVEPDPLFPVRQTDGVRIYYPQPPPPPRPSEAGPRRKTS